MVVALQKALDDMNRKLFASLPIKWRPKVRAIDKGKNIKIITTKEIQGSLITH